MKSHAARWEYVVVGLVTALLIVVTLWVQPSTTKNGGLGWDDVAYHDLARRFVAGEEPRGASPFVYRVGVPYLAAALSPGDLRAGFLAVSLSTLLAVSVVFYALIAKFVRRRWSRAVCLVAYVGAFHALPRFIPFRNFMVDAPSVLAVLVGLWGIQRWRTRPQLRWVLLVSVSTVLGVLVRESSLVPAGAFLFATQPLSTKKSFFRGLAARFRLVQTLPLLLGLGTWLAVRRLVVAEGRAGLAEQLRPLLHLARVKFPLAMPLGVALTFGPILVLACCAPRSSRRFLLRHQDLAAALMSLTFMAWIGGSDTERLLYYAAPVVFILIGRTLDRLDPVRELRWLVPLLVLQTIAARWYWVLPDSGPMGGVAFLTVFGREVAYEQLWSSHMGRALRMVLLTEYALLYAVFFWWIRARRCVRDV